MARKRKYFLRNQYNIMDRIVFLFMRVENQSAIFFFAIRKIADSKEEENLDFIFAREKRKMKRIFIPSP